MPLAEAIDTTRIPRIGGRTGGRTALVTTRPFRAPHHTISDAGRIGGGQVPMPGKVSRVHHGMLYLDALPEFRRHIIVVRRQPLEDEVTRIRPHGCRESASFGELSCMAAKLPVRSLFRPHTILA
jgi:magnesium chelatase family protein